MTVLLLLRLAGIVCEMFVPESMRMYLTRGTWRLTDGHFITSLRSGGCCQPSADENPAVTCVCTGNP